MSIKDLVEREFAAAKKQVAARHEKEVHSLETEIDELKKRTLQQLKNT